MICGVYIRDVRKVHFGGDFGGKPIICIAAGEGETEKSEPRIELNLIYNSFYCNSNSGMDHFSLSVGSVVKIANITDTILRL